MKRAMDLRKFQVSVNKVPSVLQFRAILPQASNADCISKSMNTIFILSPINSMESQTTMHLHRWFAPSVRFVFVLFALLATSGCGTTTQKVAMEQLLMSDAVDKAVAGIDFEPLANRRVYLDTTYLNQVAGFGFVNSSYVISAIRQELTASRCLLQENRQSADVVVEARVGTLGTNGHDVTYGIPATSGLSTAAGIVAGGVPLPLMPEVSFGKTDAQTGVAKIALFAYENESRQPIWQSGIAVAESRNRNTWILGAGPIQKGSLYEGTRFAGSPLRKQTDSETAELAKYFDAVVFEPVLTEPTEPATTQVAENPPDDETESVNR